MDTPLWPQQQVGSLEREMEQVAAQNNTISSNISANDPTNNAIRAPMVSADQRRARPQKDQNLNCPRCNSTNTKFCYYNNYSLTQPRYFCKTCRRYWTQGGSLRNVPVGGGSRKNRRSSISSSSSSPSSTLASSSSPSMITSTIPTLPSKMIPDLNPPSSFSHLITPSLQNPKFLEGQDLNLGFPIQGFFQPLDHQHQLPKIEASNNNNNNNVTNNENHEPISMINGNIPNVSTTTSCTTTTTSSPSCGGNNNNNNSTSISALELLRNGIASKGNLNSFVPIPIPNSNTLYPSSGFSNLQEVKPNIGVFASSGDHHHHHHHGNGYDMIGSGANVGGAARLLFPFADMNKLTSSTPTHHHDIDDHQHKGRNDHHHHHQGPTSGYWTGMLGGGTW